MKKFILLFVLMFAPALFAQLHGVDITVTIPAPDATPASIYNVYRTQVDKSVTSCSLASSYSLVGATAAGALTFSDNTVGSGASYCYYLTHLLNGVESPPSPFVTDYTTGAVVLKIPGPGAPGGGKGKVH